MPLIELTTLIKASPEHCFDLARNITLHQLSNKRTREKAIKGVTSGCIGYGQTVTWEARHLGVRQRLTSKITIFEPPYHFRDEQVKGAFSSLVHDHYFEKQQDPNLTLMKDHFKFTAPAGLLGKLFNHLILTRYMRRFLTRRNNLLKSVAEGSTIS